MLDVEYSTFCFCRGRVAESGLRHSTRNRAWGNPPWVRIPPLPPAFSLRQLRCRSKATAWLASSVPSVKAQLWIIPSLPPSLPAFDVDKSPWYLERHESIPSSIFSFWRGGDARLERTRPIQCRSPTPCLRTAPLSR